MQTVLTILTIQALLGALDNLWHHEITEKLPSKPEARDELFLHTLRELLYAVIFILIGWFTMEGVWAWVFGAILAIEIVITLTDFIVEDQTRTLPKFERVLHTVLAINFGVILAFLAPIMIDWAAQPTGLIPADYGIFSWIMTVFAVGVFVWAIRDAIAVVMLTLKRVPDWKRSPIRAGQTANARTILVAGGTGFVGKHLCRALIENGDKIIVLTRDRAKAESLFGPHIQAIEQLDTVPNDAEIDAIVNLAGARIVGPLWTKHRKHVLLKSRLETTGDILTLLDRLQHKPKVLLTASAIGYYGVRGDETLTESATPQDIFMSRLCQMREEKAALAEKKGVRVCRLRIGLVLGTDGGAFPPLARPAKFGLGAIMGTGKQWMSWIHIADVVGAIRFLIETPTIEGPVNLTAPTPVRQREFTTQLGKTYRRPVWLRVPKFAMKTLLGEMADIFVEGQRVVPAKLADHGFNFRYQTLPMALGNLIGTEDEAVLDSVQDAPDCATVYYNASCPVCRTEIEHYHDKAIQENLPVEIANIADYPDALKAFALSDEDVRQRLYVLDRTGKLRGGIDAFIAIWSTIPAYRLYAKLLRLPGLYHLGSFLYDGFLAPMVYGWDCKRRQVSVDG